MTIENKKYSSKDVVNGIVGLFVIIGICSWIFGGSKKQPEPQKVERKIAALPMIPQERLSLAIATIKAYDLVRDAAVSQSGTTLSLAIIVNPAIKPALAKEYADRFVRQVMTNAGDLENFPGKEIGPTNYAYTIGVYRPDETEMLSGYKSPAATEIRW